MIANEYRPKNPHAQALGRLNRGKPKRFSAEELTKRKARLQAGYKAWREKLRNLERQTLGVKP